MIYFRILLCLSRLEVLECTRLYFLAALDYISWRPFLKLQEKQTELEPDVTKYQGYINYPLSPKLDVKSWNLLRSASVTVCLCVWRDLRKSANSTCLGTIWNVHNSTSSKHRQLVYIEMLLYVLISPTSMSCV